MTNPADPIGRAFIKTSSEFLADDYLPKIERCLEQLDDDQIWWRPNQQSNSIGNLVLHLCGNARQWIVSTLGGHGYQRNRDAEFAQRDIIDQQELMLLVRQTVRDVCNVLESFNPESLFDRHLIQGSEVDALYAIFHVVEHFSMHTGQILLITKMLTDKDLRLYNFSTGKPVQTWREPTAE
ncbi:MAG: DinB family protein [Pyrinomonadaceae bacterium]